MSNDLAEKSVSSARHLVNTLKAGTLLSEDVANACLERIASTATLMPGFCSADKEKTLAQAREMDQLRRKGRPMGNLHGIPLCVDAGFALDFSAALFDGLFARGNAGKYRQVRQSAAVIERLREAGAVIVGSSPGSSKEGAIQNPHQPDYHAGGESAGAAAAVASGQLPIALASSVKGQMLQSASYCGVYGFLPSRGLISRRGASCQDYPFGRVGVFATALEDIALLCDALSGYDGADDDSLIAPKPDMSQSVGATVPVAPNFAVFDDMDVSFRREISQGFGELTGLLKDRAEPIIRPNSFNELAASCQYLRDLKGVFVENTGKEVDNGEDVSMAPKSGDQRGQDHARLDKSWAMIEGAKSYFTQFFYDFDAILIPSTIGFAPEIGSKIASERDLPMDDNGGNVSVYNETLLWDAADLCCLSLPLLRGPGGLCCGITLVGAQFEDDRLLRTASWLLKKLG